MDLAAGAPATTALDPAAPLLVTADSLLAAEVHRLAAAAGVVPVLAHDLATALRSWGTASVVLVGPDLARSLSEARPARRDQVHVLGRDPVADSLYRDAVGVGAESVVALPTSESGLVELLTDVGDGRRSRGALVGVLGGSGGAGASVFAAALAQVCAGSHDTLLLDTDPLGAGADRVLGLETVEGVRWDTMARTSGRLSSRSLREALPAAGRLSVLSWPADDATSLPPVAVREVLSAAVRGFETVVLDLPRHPDPLTDEVLARCDHLVLVVVLTVPGVTAAARLVGRLPRGGPSLHLVARSGRGRVSAEVAAAVLGVPLLAEMADQRGLEESVDLGAGPARARRGPLARAARAVEAQVVAAGSTDGVRGAGAVA